MEEFTRKLATVQIIEDLIPIKKKDRIELAKVLGYYVIVQKGAYEVGDRTVFFEVDSVLPQDDERHADLWNYKKTGRIKTMKMGGVISQGLCMPYDKLTPSERLKAGMMDDDGFLATDTDLTKVLRVEKYESDPDNRENGPQRPDKRCRGARRGYMAPFPGMVRKTDETRYQKLEAPIRDQQGKLCYITEKCDGSSMTLVWYKGDFMVCSRNKRLLIELPTPSLLEKLQIGWYKVKSWLLNTKNGEGKPEANPITGVFWQTVLDNELESSRAADKMIGAFPDGVAVQGELIGPGRNGNKHQLDHHEFRIFSVFDIANYRYCGLDDVKWVSHHLGMGKPNVSMVPLLKEDWPLEGGGKEMVTLSKGKSLVGDLSKREGVVVRTVDGQFSFKAINPDFLLKFDD